MSPRFQSGAAETGEDVGGVPSDEHPTGAVPVGHPGVAGGGSPQHRLGEAVRRPGSQIGSQHATQARGQLGRGQQPLVVGILGVPFVGVDEVDAARLRGERERAVGGAVELVGAQRVAAPGRSPHRTQWTVPIGAGVRGRCGRRTPCWCGRGSRFQRACVRCCERRRSRPDRPSAAGTSDQGRRPWRARCRRRCRPPVSSCPRWIRTPSWPQRRSTRDSTCRCATGRTNNGLSGQRCRSRSKPPYW